MDDWDDIEDIDIEQSCVDNCNRLKIVCTTFPKFLEYVQTIILGLVKEKVEW